MAAIGEQSRITVSLTVDRKRKGKRNKPFTACNHSHSALFAGGFSRSRSKVIFPGPSTAPHHLRRSVLHSPHTRAPGGGASAPPRRRRCEYGTAVQFDRPPAGPPGTAVNLARGHRRACGTPMQHAAPCRDPPPQFSRPPTLFPLFTCCLTAAGTCSKRLPPATEMVQPLQECSQHPEG